jgi:CubicO group peptidase (beta-lactamase class C family)
LLSALLTRAIKRDPRQFAHEHLFEPLGIERYNWSSDNDGNLQGNSGLFLTARDMAKIGRLFLRGGNWDGKQLLPQTYVAQATQAYNRGGPPVSEADYAYLWWITRPPEVAAYFAAGIFGQYIHVVPGDNVVTTVLGNASFGGARRLINQGILPIMQSCAER